MTSSKSELRKTGTLLLQASGLTYDQLKHPSPIPNNLTRDAGLLRELSFALETGLGVPRNELLSFQFIKRAAELGDPIAHGEMFLRYSFGFHHETNYKNGRLAKFDEVYKTQIFHFYFLSLYFNFKRLYFYCLCILIFVSLYFCFRVILQWVWFMAPSVPLRTTL